MKKILIILFAITPMMGFAQYDNEWIRKIIEDIEKGRPYLKGYCFAPTENVVLAQELGVREIIDDQDSRRVLRDSSSYRLPASHEVNLFGNFICAVRPHIMYANDCPEYKLKFVTKLGTIYKTIVERNFTEVLKINIDAAKYVKTDVMESVTDTLIKRGGEYQLTAENNAGTAHEVKLTVLSDPICTLEIVNDHDASYAMHQGSEYVVKIGSGYPYADRLSQYQNGEMIISISNDQNEVIQADTIKLDASADSVKVEFWKPLKKDLLLSSPKYTYRMSGPLLKEDIVLEREVTPFYAALEQAIKDAEALADFISKKPELAGLAEQAKALSDAVDAAKPCLKLSAYEQDKIDSATETLANLVTTTKEKMDQALSIHGVITDVQRNNIVKKVVDGEIRIKTNERTFNLNGIEVK